MNNMFPKREHIVAASCEFNLGLAGSSLAQCTNQCKERSKAKKSLSMFTH